ncbi:ArsR/SmtB family transcription factor [Microbacterium telephonicum]|uniref:ArsR family transcriptional regulator n=1 Tax=Microbacterium telephonicum TaxID=1714841 RepID=A0A498C0Q6_9MICO|nr:metalloregulator ArsR/SmtB family transcription factor [Microbacterium telephonicum]RLK49235.1 ArsR family transcriptional regulator [Microbacterium telephonicum]
MNQFEVLADPVRRRIVELLAPGERTAGELTIAIGEEFGISQPAVSNQLRILRETGLASAQRRGSTRLYALQPEALDEVDAWLQRQRRFWDQRLDALGTELSRGRKEES